MAIEFFVAVRVTAEGGRITALEVADMDSASNMDASECSEGGEARKMTDDEANLAGQAESLVASCIGAVREHANGGVFDIERFALAAIEYRDIVAPEDPVSKDPA